MSSTPKKPRTIHKKLKTSTQPSTGKTISYQRGRQSSQNQFIRHFHLEQPKTTQNAKFQLHQISEGNMHEIDLGKEVNNTQNGWRLSQTQKWLAQGYNKDGIFNKTRTQSSQRQLSKNQYISCLDLSELRRDRTKTSASFKPKSGSSQVVNQKNRQISEQVNRIIKQSKQRFYIKNNKKSSFNQVVNIFPPDLGKTQEFIKNKVKNCQQKKLTTTQLKMSTKVPSKVMKGPYFVKNKYQRKILVKSNNTMSLYRHTQELNKKASNSFQKQLPSGTNYNITHLQSILRNSILDLDQNRRRKLQQNHKLSQHIAKNSLIHQQLQKIRRLITGEQLNYIDISSNCPIKIYGLKGNSNNQYLN